MDGKLRCRLGATAYKKGEPHGLEAEAAARREEERRWQADVERANAERQAERRREADRRSRMPVLQGQDLVDFLAGKTDEWVVGRVGDTDGVALAEALKLARIPPTSILIQQKSKFFSGKHNFKSEYGWLTAVIRTRADPDSRDPTSISEYLLTDGRGLSVAGFHGSYEQVKIYSGSTIRDMLYRLRHKK